MVLFEDHEVKCRMCNVAESRTKTCFKNPGTRVRGFWTQRYCIPILSTWSSDDREQKWGPRRKIVQEVRAWIYA